MKELHRVLVKPLLTEKSNDLLQGNNSVTFQVDRRANKIEIKAAVEKIFNVSVVDVNTLNVKGRRKRFGKAVGVSKSWKKAVVQLKEGDKIEIFEGA